MNRYYDREGKPMELMEWARAFGKGEEKIVAATTVGEARVSTVWLGADHNLLGEGPPLIFETMIFGGPHNQFCERYSTEEEAKIGHAEIVAALEEGRDPDEAGNSAGD